MLAGVLALSREFIMMRHERLEGTNSLRSVDKYPQPLQTPSAKSNVA